MSEVGHVNSERLWLNVNDALHWLVYNYLQWTYIMIHYIVHDIHYTLHVIHYILYITNCTLHIIHYILYITYIYILYMTFYTHIYYIWLYIVHHSYVLLFTMYHVYHILTLWLSCISLLKSYREAARVGKVQFCKEVPDSWGSTGVMMHALKVFGASCDW